MALLTNRILCRLCLKKLRILKPIGIRNKCDKIVALQIDSLDEFTNQLIQRKIEKWNIKDTGHTINDCDHFPKPSESLLDLKLVTEERLNSLIQEKIEIEDTSAIVDIVKQCIELKKCPSVSNIMYILNVCAQRGDKKLILAIIDLCNIKIPDVLESYSNFQHFLAQAIWVHGNIHEALELYETVYRDNSYLRRQIRLMLKHLISDVISNKSEAVLINVVKFCEKIYKTYQDIFPLIYIWQTCFLSEWFHDQELAIQLLNVHTHLRKAVMTRLQYVVAVSLRKHRTEIVYRLLEVLLKHNMKQHYVGVILPLLNYQIHQRDLKGCVETIRWSLENDINLPAIHNEKFLNLVLNQEDNRVISKKKLQVQKKSFTVSEFKF